ncbi:MAG: translocation/assembly module TamB domain-containing protein [Nitrospirota bacterium]
MKRALLALSASGVILLAAIAGGIGFLVATERGLQLLLPRLVTFLPGEVSIEEARGRLIGPLSLNGVRYRAGGTTVTLERLSLDWMPYFLLSGEVYVTELNARGITVTTAGAEEGKAPSPPQLPEIRLPLAVTVRNALLSDITLVRGAPAPPVIINRIALDMDSGLMQTLRIRKLDIEMPSLSARLKGSVRTARNYPFDLTAEWTAASEGYPRMEGGGAAEGTLERFIVRQQLRAPFEATVTAVIADPFTTLRWGAHLRIQKLSPRTIRGEWPAVLLQGAFKGQGYGSSFDMEGDFTAADTGYGTLKGEVSLSRGEEELTVHRLVLALQESTARATLSGTYVPAGPEKGRDPVSARGSWSGLTWPLRGKDPALASPQGSFTVAGSPDAYRFTIDFGLEGKTAAAGGEGIRWTAHGTAAGHGDTSSVTVKTFQGRTLEGTVSGSGSIAWRPALDWTVSLRGKGINPGVLWPDWQGSIGLRASLSGKDRSGAVLTTIDLQEARGKVRGYPLAAALRLSMSGSAYWLQKARLSSGGTVITASGAVADTWNLSWELVSPKLDALLPAARGSLKGSGSVNGPRAAPFIAAALSGRNLAFRNHSAEALDAEVGLDMQDIRPSRIDLSAAGLRIAGQTVRAAALKGTGRLSSHTLSAEIRTGRVTLPLRAEGGYRDKVWQGSLTQARLITEDYGTWTLASPGPLAVNTATGAVRTGEWCLANASSRLCLYFTFSWNTQAIEGTINAELRELGLIAALVPTLQNTSGLLKADLAFSGTAAEPQVAGRLALEQGAATVPDLGIRLVGIQLSASGSGGGPLRIEGRALSGPGSITVSGTASLGPGQAPSLSLRVTGREFLAYRKPDARILASPDIAVTIKGRCVEASGELLIPEASITPRSGAAAVPVSEDVVIVSEREERKKKRDEEEWKIYARIRIVLGDRVSFSGFGLNGNVRGSVLVVDEPGQLTTAQGELSIVNGRYTAYGRSLQIDRGRLLFAGGPVTNPVLDMSAVRKAGDVTAGVRVQGNLRNPRLTLFSTPTMEQTQILSYLILGQPLQSATSEEGQLLYRAATSLSLSGGEFLARRIGRTFGIQDIRIEKGTTIEEAALVLGTYLSPRLYVSYGIGLFEPAGRLLLRYDLSRRLQLRVESGVESGADLLYQFER